LQAPVVIDEVQKVPQLLDEIHWLIENKGLQFILCGSSARKLKRGKANLLGGRAST
jgi:predicted AAA+ superfamily ATPase